MKILVEKARENGLLFMLLITKASVEVNGTTKADTLSAAAI